jgi:hypothetical protein
MMRGIVTLVALLIGVWYLRDRQRRSRLRESLRDSLATRRDEPGGDRASSVNEMASRVQSTVNEVRANVPETVRRVADLATSAVQSSLQQVQERAGAAGQSEGDATATQDAAATPGGDRQAAQPATDQAPASGGSPEARAAEAQVPPAPDAPQARSDGAGSTQNAEEAPPTPGAGETAATSGAEQLSGFIGNVNSRVYHSATSPNLPAEENRIAFATEEEALAAGFRASEGEGLAGEDESGT